MSRYSLRQRDQQNMSMNVSKTALAHSNAMDNIVARVKAGEDMDQIQRLTHDYIMGQPTSEARLEAVINSLKVASAGSETLGAVAVEAWSLLAHKTVWQGKFASVKEARNALDTPHLAAIRRLFGQGERRKNRAINNIKSQWSTAVHNQELIKLGEHHLEAIGTIADRYTYAEARDLLFKIRNRRLRRDTSGRSASRQITTGDWKALRLLQVKEKQSLLQELALSAAECRKYGIKSDKESTIIHAPGKISNEIRCQRRRYRKSILRQAQTQHIDSDTTLGDEDESEVAAETGPASKVIEEVNDDNEGSTSDGDGDGDSGNNSSDNSGEDDSFNGDSDEDLENIAEWDDDPDYVDSTALKQNGQRESSCGCANVSTALRDRIRRANKLEAGMATDAARIDTIRQLILAGPKGLKNLDHICYTHLRAVDGHCGLQTKVLKREELQLRIQTIYQSRDDLDALRTNSLRHSWFRRADRPAVPEDRLGIYSVKSTNHIQLTVITDVDAARLVEEVSSSENAWPMWLEEGSLNVRGMFAWMFNGMKVGEQQEAGIGPLIEEEFLMYEHHQREINGKPNRGWLRTMLYSLTQQLIRQDLQYYLLYVAMRPDHKQRLVSYPYYTKFARPGDSTFFQHIDMNIPEFLETGRGGNIVQGSVSLDDETAETGCTIIVPGMHRRLREWWGEVVQRSNGDQMKGTSGRVHNVKPLWHSDDAAKYGDWTPVPCHRGDVRITKPELLHGSTETLKVRRTVLPWFVGVGPDSRSLDTAESGTWDDLCIAHTRQTAPHSSPSGHPNMYGAIPHRFGPATRLLLDSPVSQALVCCRPWDDPAVIDEANVLLGPDRSAANRRIATTRLQALRLFKVQYERQAEAERMCFGPDSFYERRDRGELEIRPGEGGQSRGGEVSGEVEAELDGSIEG